MAVLKRRSLPPRVKRSTAEQKGPLEEINDANLAELQADIVDPFVAARGGSDDVKVGAAPTRPRFDITLPRAAAQ